MIKKNKNTNSVSVIIATKNRPNQLNSCVNELLKSITKPIEIIVVDQSENLKTKKVLLNINNKLVRYFHLNSKGKSKSLNLGITKAKGNILAFTDDDCLVDISWISNIKKTFKKHKDISLCFGKTLPHKPKQHKKEICPCTFQKNPNRFIITKKPGKHWEKIGFGNNMIIKTSVFKKIGNFEELLGPGSIGSNAEDAEFINRSLIKGYEIGYEPSIVVSHNKWLSKEQMDKQEWSYSCGEMACYGWFALSGHRFAKQIVKNGLKKIYWDIKENKSSNTIWGKITSQFMGLSVAIAIYFKKAFNH